MIIDLRSDTVTKPTPPMLNVMMQAQVGDDVFGEDPTVLQLETKLAAIFGMDEGMFCPSGTMTNQIAIRLLTQPQDEVICDKNAHIYLYEGGGIAYNSFVSPKLLSGDRGRLNAQQIVAHINPDDIHLPRTRLVALENTMNKGGGSCYQLSEIEAIHKVCQQNQLALHLDGARIFNALVATGESPTEYGKYFDTISVCLSKGLGAPVGSVLLMKKHLKPQAMRIRKVMGGGMRQVGHLAAAGIYALDHHVERLAADHQRAKLLGEAFEQASWVKHVYPVDTNIVIFEVNDVELWSERLSKAGILSVKFGSNAIRLVTHLQFDDEHLAYTLQQIKKL